MIYDVPYELLKINYVETTTEYMYMRPINFYIRAHILIKIDPQQIRRNELNNKHFCLFRPELTFCFRRALKLPTLGAIGGCNVGKMTSFFSNFKTSLLLTGNLRPNTLFQLAETIKNTNPAFKIIFFPQRSHEIMNAYTYVVFVY